MTLDDITTELRRRVGDNAGLGTTVKFDFSRDGTIFIDDVARPPTVDNVDRDAQCTMTVSKADFEEIAAGRMDATSAYMAGKLRVDDIATAMKIAALLR